MKKFLLFFASIFAATNLLMAQSECMQFYPNTPGATLVNKTFDAQNNLMNVTTYTINQVYDYSSSTNMLIGFIIADKDGNTVDSGNIEAYCDNGTFYTKMVNRSMTSDVMNMLSTNTEMVGNFLDYPNIFSDNDGYPFDDPFEMGDGDFTIQSKADKKEMIRVHVYNRRYIKNEKVTTPAKESPFHAAKVTFDFDVTKNKVTTKYKGIEWYAANAGIVKSETYDSNNKLVTTTILTTLKDK